MGVTRWLHRIDPAVWDRVVRRIDEDPVALLDRAASAAFLRELGKEPSDDTFDMLDDGDDETARAATLNALLENATSEETWGLDKSLDTFSSVAALVDGGGALLKIIDFKGLDIDLPNACRLIEGGLFGCCSAKSIADVADFVRRFPSAEHVASALDGRESTFVDNLLGRGSRAKSTAERMREDYYVDYWTALCSAVSETVSKGHYLGLGMSP